MTAPATAPRLARSAARFMAWALAALNASLCVAADANDIYIEDHRLHINCEGSGRPTVILDAGLGGSSLEWVFVSERLRELTRVCSYDRAGYGDSDSGPNPRTSSRIANELYLLLDGAGLPPPYILVGHSFGGYNMQMFARRYPFLTAGLVLIDASHPDQVERFLAPPLNMLTAPSSRYGIVQFRDQPRAPMGLPATIAARIRERAQRWQARRTLASELLSFRDSAAELRTAPPLGALPLIVITRGKIEGEVTEKRLLIEKLWLAMQTELAAASSASAHLLARESGHHIHIEQPDLVAFAVAMLIERFRVASAGSTSSGLVDARAGFKLDGASWLTDNLSLYPVPVLAAAPAAKCVALAGQGCTGAMLGAP